jgi:ZIP family zinc transporter
MAIFITLLAGLSFLVGYLITLFVKNEKKLLIFSVGFSFTVILGLTFLHMIPEALELIQSKVLLLIFVFVGIGLLKLLDFFVPDHGHEHSKKSNHMEHIGIISGIALIIHNMLEGTAIYTTSLNNTTLGLMMALGVCFHNIPLGIQVSSLIKDKKNKLIMICLLVASCLSGVVYIEILNIVLTDMVSGLLMGVTIGMLIYISLFELYCEVVEHIKSKILHYGLVFGILIIVVGHLLH